MNETDRDLLEDALDAVKDVCTDTLTYRRRFKGEYDPETRRTDTPPSIETQVFALKKAAGANDFIAGTTVEAGDVALTVPAAQIDFQPAPGDEMDFEGKTWTVKAARPQYGVAEVIMWELQVRHG